MSTNRPTRDLSDLHEQHVAAVLDGRCTRGSGSSFVDQTDGKQGYRSQEFVLAWECKSTMARSMTFKLADWDKAEKQSQWAYAVMPLRFYRDAERLSKVTDLVVVDLELLATLQEMSNETVSLRDEVAKLREDNDMLRNEIAVMRSGETTDD